MKELDQNDLRYVLSLSRTGRIAAAARKLGVDGSTFSRRIARIESRLGVRLFQRNAGVLTPTEPGKVVVRKAESIELEFNAVTDSATSARQA
jgi:DNA-binding transcriptional LysR family regulator